MCKGEPEVRHIGIAPQATIHIRLPRSSQVSIACTRTRLHAAGENGESGPGAHFRQGRARRLIRTTTQRLTNCGRECWSVVPRTTRLQHRPRARSSRGGARMAQVRSEAANQCSRSPCVHEPAPIRRRITKGRQRQGPVNMHQLYTAGGMPGSVEWVCTSTSQTRRSLEPTSNPAWRHGTSY